MNHNTDTTGTHEYQIFWQDNLQRLDEINGRIEKSLIALEKKYFDFDSMYQKLTDEIDVLLSIYSSFNNILGLEYLLKLKSLLNDYKTRYTHEGIRFNVLYFLHSRIRELRDASFSKFPELRHVNDTISNKVESCANEKNMPYKWITFERNNSWFITQYTQLSVLPYRDIIHEVENRDNEYRIRVSGQSLVVRDLMNNPNIEKWEKPDHYIIISNNNEMKCYAAKKKGKRIFAKQDVLSKKIKKYSSLKRHLGYVRIFGKNHIYLS